MTTLAERLQPSEDFALDEAYFVFIESYVQYFLTHPNTAPVVVNSVDALRYRGDFYGLLNVLRVDKNYHYLVMRMNGMRSAMDYDGMTVAILMPALSDVQRIIGTYTSKEV